MFITNTNLFLAQILSRKGNQISNIFFFISIELSVFERQESRPHFSLLLLSWDMQLGLPIGLLTQLLTGFWSWPRLGHIGNRNPVFYRVAFSQQKWHSEIKLLTSASGQKLTPAWKIDKLDLIIMKTFALWKTLLRDCKDNL